MAPSSSNPSGAARSGVDADQATHDTLKCVRAVALDLDGTLLDTLADLGTAANAMLGELGHRRLPIEAFRTMVGKGMANLVRRALVAATGEVPPDSRFAEALEVYERCYLDVAGDQTVAFPGVVEALDAFAAMGLPLACITNKKRRFAMLHLERLELEARFAVVVGGDSLAARKPDPLPLLHCAGVLDVAPARMLMIGDSQNDALAARAAGCPILLVPYGYSEGVPIESIDADGIVRSLEEVAARLAPAAPVLLAADRGPGNE